MIQNVIYDQQSLTITIKEGGKFGFYSDLSDLKVLTEGKEIACNQLHQNLWVADIQKSCKEFKIIFE